jgi:hypothetical protein
MADDDEEEPPKRVDLTVSAHTYRFLAALKKRGTHGGSVAKVARSLIESGIREAIDKGYIKLDAGEK